jgi:hypothetical protein
MSVSTPIILYSNEILNASSISVTSEAAGYAKENAYDWLTWDYWKPTAAGTVYYTVDMGSATSIDTWGAYAHDLGDNSATIQLQYSTDNFSADINNFGSAISPTAGEPVLQTGTSQSKRYWRFKIVSSTTASRIGGLILGAKLSMEEGLRPGYEPDSNRARYEYMTNMSEAGTRLGGSKRKIAIEGFMYFDLLTRAWVESNWEPFVRHFETGKGWLYCPDIDNYPNEVSYCWYDKGYKGPTYQYKYYGAVTLPYMCIVD